MQDIATKLARVRPARPEGWTDDDLRRLIHGVGGSPRRAACLLRSDVERAAHFRDAYSADIKEGMSHSAAVVKANDRYAEAFDSSNELSDDELLQKLGVNPAPAPAAEPAPAPIPAKRQRRSLTELAAQMAG